MKNLNLFLSLFLLLSAPFIALGETKMSEIDRLIFELSLANCVEEETRLVEEILELPPHQRSLSYRVETENDKKVVYFLNAEGEEVIWTPISENNFGFIYLE